MSSTNKTANFNLPQFGSGDKPSMLDFNQAFQNLSDAKGAAGGMLSAPAVLPATDSMLKMADGGTVAPAVEGTDYGTRITQLWSGFQTTTGTITLSQSIANFKVIVLEMLYNNNPIQGMNENIYFPATVGTGAQFPFCHAFGTIRYLICTMSGTSISISDVSALNGSGLFKVFGIK